MAKKPSKKTAVTSSNENVVRIKASSSSKKSSSVDKKPTTVKSKSESSKDPKIRRKVKGAGIFGAFLGYFKGAWYELRQVRWPNRRATWSLTGAVIVYSLFFVALILLLDALFKYLLELIIG